MEEIEFIIEVCEESMKNAIKHLEKELLNIRAGKANPSMLASIKLDYYGSLTPLSQIANINTPDAQTISVQPWEKDKLIEIYNHGEKLVRKSLKRIPNGNYSGFGQMDNNGVDEGLVKFKISIEAGVTNSWEKFIGQQGLAFGIDDFGKSAPYKNVYKHFGLTSENITKEVKEMLNK